MNNLFENWNDTASWTTDGSLQYDERNHVLYFDKTKVYGKVVRCKSKTMMLRQCGRLKYLTAVMDFIFR